MSEKNVKTPTDKQVRLHIYLKTMSERFVDLYDDFQN